MNHLRHSIIAATGCYIPETSVPNEAFLHHHFLEKDGTPVKKDNAAIIEKFREITGIEARRYALADQNASDIGYLAARNALESGGIDKESLDYIIVAHNFGDVRFGSHRSDIVPSLASRIKLLLQISNPDCVAYDLPFGCPGWVEGMIQAQYFIGSGDAERCLVIGTETLSRVVDPFDRDSMLYGDGSGAAVLVASEDPQKGILAHKTRTFAAEQDWLHMAGTYEPQSADRNLFLKMTGRKVYEFALSHVPAVIKAALDKADVHISEVNKVLIHQANAKMDAAILDRLFKLYDQKNDNPDIMPMTISWLGNSSVATVPTLLDLVQKGKLENQQINPGDKVVFASVGAGMNINAIVYQY